jgi:hypothetical protein
MSKNQPNLPSHLFERSQMAHRGRLGAIALVLVCLEPSYGWIHPRHHNCMQPHQLDGRTLQKHQPLNSAKGVGDDTACTATSFGRRRSFIASIGTIASVLSLATSTAMPSNAADDDVNKNQGSSSSTAEDVNRDPLDAFGQELAAKWPNTPSPLPTFKSSSSADELSMLDTLPSSSSDLLKTLEQAKAKKNIGPRTHG